MDTSLGSKTESNTLKSECKWTMDITGDSSSGGQTLVIALERSEEPTKKYFCRIHESRLEEITDGLFRSLKDLAFELEKLLDPKKKTPSYLTYDVRQGGQSTMVLDVEARVLGRNFFLQFSQLETSQMSVSLGVAHELRIHGGYLAKVSQGFDLIQYLNEFLCEWNGRMIIKEIRQPSSAEVLPMIIYQLYGQSPYRYYVTKSQLPRVAASRPLTFDAGLEKINREMFALQSPTKELVTCLSRRDDMYFVYVEHIGLNEGQKH